MGRNQFSRRITFELGLGLPLILLAVGLCLTFFFLPVWRRELTFVSVVVGGAAALYSAFYVGAATREQADRQRMSNTYELIRSVDEPELLRLREELDQAIDHKKVAPQQILGMINEEPELRIAARGLLNSFEDIAVAIRTGYADERLVHASLGSLMCTSAEKYSSFIEEERRRYESESIYKELERVVGSWKGGQYHMTNDRIPSDPCQKIRS